MASNEATYNQAVKLIKDGKPTKATEKLIKHLKDDPNDVQAWWLVAKAAQSEKQAKQALEHVLEIRPNNKRARAMMHELAAGNFKPVESDEKPKTKPQKQAGAGDFGLKLMSFGIFILFLAIGVIIVDKVLNVQRDMALGLVEDYIWALESEDVGKYESIIHSYSPMLDLAGVNKLFKDYDLDYDLVKNEIIEMTDTEIRVAYEYNVKKIAGGSFPSSTVSGEIIITPDEEEGWRIDMEMVYDVVVQN